MIEKKEIESDVVEQKDPPTAISAVGQELKSLREKENMKQEEVAAKLNLDITYIVAIEEDDYSKITSMSYVNGYIRSYARLLKIPEHKILEMCQQKSDKESNLVPNYMDQRTLMSDSSRQNISWVLLFFIVMGLLVAGWWFTRQ